MLMPLAKNPYILNRFPFPTQIWILLLAQNHSGILVS